MGEPEPVNLKVLVCATLAQMPVLVEVLVRALNLHLGTVDIDLDTCSRPLSQLEVKENINLQFVDGMLYRFRVCKVIP